MDYSFEEKKNFLCLEGIFCDYNLKIIEISSM